MPNICGSERSKSAAQLGPDLLFVRGCSSWRVDVSTVGIRAPSVSEGEGVYYLKLIIQYLQILEYLVRKSVVLLSRDLSYPLPFNYYFLILIV